MAMPKSPKCANISSFNRTLLGFKITVDHWHWTAVMKIFQNRSNIYHYVQPLLAIEQVLVSIQSLLQSPLRLLQLFSLSWHLMRMTMGARITIVAAISGKMHLSASLVAVYLCMELVLQGGTCSRDVPRSS
ncbi:hypothetical protein WN943_012159 [Citrus x changshan-huyou]